MPPEALTRRDCYWIHIGSANIYFELLTLDGAVGDILQAMANNQEYAARDSTLVHVFRSMKH